MSKNLNKSPPRGANGALTVPQHSIHQSYLNISAMPYYEQAYQHGIRTPTVNLYEGRHENNCWYPQQSASSYQPYYQPSQSNFGPMLPLQGYPISPNYNPNHHNHPRRYEYPPPPTNMNHGKYSPIYWQSPPSQYMTVPQNSPVHSTVSPTNQSYRLPAAPIFKKPVPTQSGRHRAPTFPGANAPNLTFFEGSKKSDWSIYSSDTYSNSQWSEGQKSESSKRNSHASTMHQLIDSSKAFERKNTDSNGRSGVCGLSVSQDARNFLHSEEDVQRRSFQARRFDSHHLENRFRYHNHEHSPPRAGASSFASTRKLYPVRPTTIEAAIPNITWVEQRAQLSLKQSEETNHSEDSACYPEPLSSVDSASLSPVSTSARLVKSSSPLIVTSVPTAAKLVYEHGRSFSLKTKQASSVYAVDKTRKTKFIFNPEAENFVLVQGTDDLKLSEQDEYVGFYLGPNVTSSYSPTASLTPFMYNCDPMAWQVPDCLTPKTPSLKSCGDGDCSCSNQSHLYVVENPPKEFFGKVPNNMNWEKKFVPVVDTKTDTSLRSEDSAEITAAIVEAGDAILDEHQERMDSALGVVEIPKISKDQVMEVVDANLAHDIGSELLVEDVQEVTSDEVAQTIVEDVKSLEDGVDSQPAKDPLADELFEEDVERVAKFPSCIVDITLAVKLVNCADCTEGVEPHATSKSGKSSLDGKALEPCAQPSAIEIKAGPKAKAKVKAKSKKSKSKTKLRNKHGLNPEAMPEAESGPIPELKTEIKQVELDIQPQVESENETESKLQIENPLEKSALHPEYRTPPRDEEKLEATQKLLLVSEHKSVPGIESKFHSSHASIATLLNTPDPIKGTKTAKVLNYRDALLTKVANPRTLISSPNIAHPQAAPQKAINTKVTERTNSTEVKISPPPVEIGGRRKFFLHPLPPTATYDSVIKQLKGGMLEDVYISGLSPHPSAWKGSRGESRYQPDFPHDNGQYGHVSFYSEEGASKFWELVHSGKGNSGPYHSRYGGFDDQEPGTLLLDGVRVFVHWRHNDQRVVNPLTLKAVTEDKATRFLLLTFNAEAAFGSRNMTPFLAITRESKKGDEFAFLKKVAADIEIWGQADSNLQGIHLLDESKKDNVLNSTATSSINKPFPKQVRVLVKFIRLLTAVKVKKYFASRSEYGQNGFCRVEYYKDECDESIDTFKKIRETKALVAKQEAKGTNEADPRHVTQIALDSKQKRHTSRTILKENLNKEQAVAKNPVKAAEVKSKVVERSETGIKQKEKALGGRKKVHPSLREAAGLLVGKAA